MKKEADDGVRGNARMTWGKLDNGWTFNVGHVSLDWIEIF